MAKDQSEGGCCQNQPVAAQGVQAQGISDWISWGLGHIDEFEQIIALSQVILADMPTIGASGGVSVSVMAANAESSIIASITSQAQAKGITGDRLKKLLEAAGPIIKNVLIPLLLQRLTGSLG